MALEVIRSSNFLYRLKKLDKSYLDRVEKQIEKIIQNPKIGKPMRHNRKETREVYVNPFRLSYSHNQKEDLLIFLDFYHKDEQ